jgi:glyoxylase-like metal-dependent hydrolase (beta-lactamase superfamily II)
VNVTEILPGVHIVSPEQRAGLSSGTMNICLLVENGQITVVDTGMPGSAAALLAAAAEIGLTPQAIRRVIITHHHVDHVGGLPDLLAATQAEVWAHRDDAGTIDGSVPRVAIPPERIEAMLADLSPEQRVAAAARMKQMAAVAPAKVDLRLVGGEELNILGGVQILHSPGHTAGHLCLYAPALSLLIAGDLLRLEGGDIHESPIGFAADADQSLASARQIVRLEFDRFVGYHGDYVLAGAKALLSDSLLG